MDPSEPSFLYVALILPSLFGLTLVLEGVYEILRKEFGWLNLAFGMTFLLIIIGSYFFVLK